MNFTTASVWHRHRYVNDVGQEVTCRVQDTTPDIHERLMHYYKTQFLFDETVCKNLNWAEDEVSVVEYIDLMKEALSKGGSVVVIEEATESSLEAEVIGAGLYMVSKKEDQDVLRGEGASFQKLLALIGALKSHPEADPRNRSSSPVSHYMTGCGMWVRRDRRRRGIAEAIIRGVLKKCQASSIPNFTAFYTGTGSQRAAVKAGLKEVCRVNYADIKDEDGKPSFPNMNENYCILLGTDIERSV